MNDRNKPNEGVSVIQLHPQRFDAGRILLQEKYVIPFTFCFVITFAQEKKKKETKQSQTDGWSGHAIS
jgi:hypothetical protein